MVAAADPRTAEGVLRLLRGQGGRLTTSRRLLVEALFAGGDHKTAEELATEVQVRAPDVHLSTIYRNLDELERLGVLVHSHLGHGPATYHLAAEAHGHLVCERCGGTIEVGEEIFGALVHAARKRHGFVVDTRHFAISGQCAACAAADEVTPAP